MEFLNQIIDFALTYQSGFIAAGAAFLGFYLLRAIGIAYIQKLSEKTTNDIDDLFVNLLKSLKFIFGVMISVLVGFVAAGVSLASVTWLNALVVLVVTYQIVRAAGVLFRYIMKKAGPKGGTASVQGLATVLQMGIWFAGIAFLLAQLGYNITSLVAGLGIGGVAVALAVQSILSDVFSSFSIYFDKPFMVGDFIEVNGMSGTVERIGMKTTRIRSLSGEEIVLSNKQLTDSALHNYGKMHRRRAVHHIGFEYGTESEKLEKFKKDIGEIVDAEELATFDRCHFQSFGDSALIHELVYFAETAEYIDFVDLEHRVNMDIKKYCEENGLEMAFPTQTLYVKKS
jgi:small-conductance mechanosensitive channel